MSCLPVQLQQLSPRYKKYLLNELHNVKQNEFNEKFKPFNNLKHQPHISTTHRTIFVDWMLHVTSTENPDSHKMLKYTPYVAVNIVDRMLSLRITSEASFSLLCQAAIYMANNVHEDNIEDPNIKRVAHKARDILAEKIDFISIYDTLSILVQLLELKEDVEQMAWYLSKICLLAMGHNSSSPSMVAAASCALAMYYYDCLHWEVGAKYSGYELYSLKPLITKMHWFFTTIKDAKGTCYSKQCEGKGIGHNNEARKLFEQVLKLPSSYVLYISWDQPMTIVNYYQDVQVFCER